MDNLGNVEVDSTIEIVFDTHGADGERLAFDTAIEAADIRIYKNGVATQRTGVSGITLSETFNSMVGMHQVQIDLSDNDDAGFYAAGSKYKVALYPDETLNSQNVAKWIGSFAIADVTVAKTVWDRVLSGATHNIASSAGRRLRQIESIIVLATGTAQAGAASTITLAAGADANNNFYKHALITIVGGTGAGQIRLIESYNGTTKVANIVDDWIVNPDVTSEYEIAGFGLVHSHAVDHLDDLTKTASTHIFETVFTNAITEAYSAKGAAPTLAQFICEVLSELREFAISSTTMTNKKLDGSTTAYTSTLNDATNPTAKERAT